MVQTENQKIRLIFAEMMNDRFDLKAVDDVTENFDTLAFCKDAGLLLQALIELQPVILECLRQ